MNYSTSQRRSALTSCCVLWGGEATTSSTSSQGGPPHDSPRIEHPKNLDFPEDRASFQRAAVE